MLLGRIFNGRQFVNIAPSLPPSIFDLYDSASKGQSYLLETLRCLFDCHWTSIQEYPSTDDPINFPHTFNAETQPYFIKYDSVVTALRFNSNNLVNCYLLIHYSPQNNQTPPSAQVTSELSDHIIEALNISYTMTRQENDLKSVHYVLDHYPIPAMAIDDNQNTIFINQAAQHLLQKASTQTLTKQESLLRLCQSDSYYKLKQALTNSLTGNSVTSRHLNVDVNETSFALIVTTANTVPNVFKHFSRNNISWVYLLNPDYSVTLKSNPEFQALGLSTAEIELSCAFFSGQSLNDIAEQRHVSKQTVRKQLQSVLRKTDCESQENLMIFFFENYIHYGLTH